MDASLKDSDERIRKHAERWALSCPKAAMELIRLSSRESSFCRTEKDEQNLQRIHQGKAEYYHAQEGAKEEAERWFRSLNLFDIKTLFVYGIGLGYYFLAAKQWLAQDETHQLVFLEDDLEVIRQFFKTDLAAELLCHQQVRLHYFKKTNDRSEEDALAENELFVIPIFYFVGEIAFSALNYYQKKFSDELQLIHNQLEYIKNCRAFQLLEYINYGETFFQNFYRNMFSLPSAYLSEKMFGKFNNIPAIICGAGPSLEKQIPLLETLADRALIFAGGSSMNTLGVSGFLPHFGVSIDPNWNQYARLFMNQAFQVPFFYRNRIFPQALSLIQGDRLYVPGSGGHEIADYFERRLQIPAEERVSEGNNVVNFSLSIATALGCNPIIFVGVDLAYTDNKSYSPGIIPHPILDVDREIATRMSHEELIMKTDIYGRSVPTLWKWISESMWISQFAMTHPELEVVNATEGGIGFDGVKNVPFKEVVEKHLRHSLDLQVFMHGEIQNAAMPEVVTEERITEAMQELVESLMRCREKCNELRREFHKVLKAMQETQQIPENILTGEALEFLKKLNEEEAYQRVLHQFNRSFLSYLGKKEQDLAHSTQKEELNPLEMTKRRALMNKKRYEFLQAVCDSNLQQIKAAENAEKIKEILFGASKNNQEILRMSELEQFVDSSQILYEIRDGIFSINDPSLGIQYEGPVGARHQLFYPSGAIKMEQHHQQGKLHGPTSYFSEEGALLARGWFVSGARQGKQEAYYKSGKLHSIQRYKAGLREGVQECYYSGGELKSLLEYHAGKLHGRVVFYFPHGIKMRELYFREGERHGQEQMWNIGGIKELDGCYKANRPTGVFKSWSPIGTLSREVVYDESGAVVDVKGWDIDGVPLPQEQLFRKDYFDQIIDQTSSLTNSLETVFKEFELMTTLVLNKKTESAPPHGPDMSEELEEIKQELNHLQAIHQEILSEHGPISKEAIETIWKTPQVKRLLGKQIEEMTGKMADDAKELEDAMHLLIEFLAKHPPQKDHET